MTSSGKISDLRGIKRNLYFWKAHEKSYPTIQFSWLCCIPYGSYKEDNLKEGRMPPPFHV